MFLGSLLFRLLCLLNACLPLLLFRCRFGLSRCILRRFLFQLFRFAFKRNFLLLRCFLLLRSLLILLLCLLLRFLLRFHGPLSLSFGFKLALLFLMGSFSAKFGCLRLLRCLCHLLFDDLLFLLSCSFL